MGSVMGNTLGRAVENMAKGVAEQMQAAQEQAAGLQQAAEQAIRADPQINQHLGDNVQVAQPISQSSSTQIVNGERAQMVKSLWLQNLTTCRAVLGVPIDTAIASIGPALAALSMITCSSEQILVIFLVSQALH